MLPDVIMQSHNCVSGAALSELVLAGGMPGGMGMGGMGMGGQRVHMGGMGDSLLAANQLLCMLAA